MIVTAREFTNAAEMRAHAAAVHARCFNPRLRLVSSPPAADHAPVVRFFAKQLPAWESGLLTFDAHVIAYHLSKAISSFSMNGSARPAEVWDAPVGRRSISAIVMEVLERYPEVTVRDIQSGRRPRHITEPRRKSMYAVYIQRPDLSLPMIARWFRKDHTTIIHAVNRTKEILAAENSAGAPIEFIQT